MASITIVYWRDIPAQVIAKVGRKAAKVVLDERFEKAIDQAAMRAKLRDTDSYLAEWRRSDPLPCGEDLEQAAAEAARRLELEFDKPRLDALVAAGGLDATTPGRETD